MTIKKAPKIEVIEEVRKLVKKGKWLLEPHAITRMKERGVTSPEIEFVLLHGYHEKEKDRYEHGEIRYSIRGSTRDDAPWEKELRLPIVIEGDLVVITVIDLTRSPDKEKGDSNE